MDKGAMSGVRAEVLSSLKLRDPFEGFPRGLYGGDIQGWGGDHRYLAEEVLCRRNPLVVEVGVWKGGSTIAMALAMKEAGIEGVVLAVDTFLGSVEHYINPDWTPSLVPVNGYPHLYYTFLGNCVLAGVEAYVIPMPLDSRNASQLFGFRGLVSDVVHIDASHDYESVKQDIDQWFALLRPGGTLICDDYREDDGWPGVKRAVNEFASSHIVEGFESESNKCRFRKPVY